MAAILVMWPLTINNQYKFTPLNLKSLHMKDEFNWPCSFWENYVLIHWWDYNISDIGWKVKGQLDLWDMFKAIFSLGLTYQLRIMTMVQQY